MTQVTQSGQTGGNAVAEKRVDFAYDPLEDYRYESITRYADLSGTKMVAATDYSYDANNRLVALTHSDSLSATLAGYTWAYDHAGRLTDFTVAGYSDEDATYNYDDTDQLIGADRAGTANDESYTYDENGNRIGGGYTVGDNNQLLSDGTFNYTYDAEGNRTLKENISTGETVEYIWDHSNRLIEIITQDDLSVVIHEVQYTYDIFNHRIVKTIDADGAGSATATQEIYVYDGLREQRGNAGDHILLIFDEEGDLTTRTLYGPDVDQILATEDVDDLFTEGETLWALTDHQGSVRDIAEHDATTGVTSILNHIVYDAFGQITAETDPTVVFFVAFTGRERDLESDLQYNRFRYYDAAIGRWMSEDPIGFDAGDENLVRYVGNGAARHVDPSGQKIEFNHENQTPESPKTPTRNSFVSRIFRQDLSTLYSRTGKLAITGSSHNVYEMGIPKAFRWAPEDLIWESPDQFCAPLMRAPSHFLHITTFIPDNAGEARSDKDNGIDYWLSPKGRDAVEAQAMRRISVYEIAFENFFSPISGYGEIWHDNALTLVKQGDCTISHFPTRTSSR